MHEAERLASQLLSKGTSLSSADITRLYDVLPKEVSARDPDGRIPSSFSTGAYNKGGLTGLRKAAHDFPTTTRCLAQFGEKFLAATYLQHPEYLRQCLHGIV